MADQKHHVQAQPTGARKMAPKKGIGSYPAGEPGSGPSGGETGGKDDVNLDERMGSNKPRKDGKGDLASDPGTHSAGSRSLPG